MDLDAVWREWERKRRHFAAFLDVRLETVEPGVATLRMPFRVELTNDGGAVHGGAITSLCDTAFYVAHASAYGWEQASVTTGISCNFLAAARGPEDIVARAELVRSGKRVAFGEVRVYSGQVLVAQAIITFLNV